MTLEWQYQNPRPANSKTMEMMIKSTDAITQRQRGTAGNKKDDDQWIAN